MKDLFSHAVNAYHRYRPVYPDSLFEFINELPCDKNRCWDSATGNGQLAVPMSDMFQEVQATDLSTRQLSRAPIRKNIAYTTQPSEQTSFPDNYFDLVTIGQAIHWLDFDHFYGEVHRVTTPNAYLVVVGYGLIQNKVLQKHIDRLYHDILGNFWEPERDYIDAGYQTIPFPFKEVESPQLEITKHWSFEDMRGYFSTWSSAASFTKIHGKDPFDLIGADLHRDFRDEIMEVTFPLLLRTGKING